MFYRWAHEPRGPIRNCFNCRHFFRMTKAWPRWWLRSALNRTCSSDCLPRNASKICIWSNRKKRTLQLRRWQFSFTTRKSQSFFMKTTKQDSVTAHYATECDRRATKRKTCSNSDVQCDLAVSFFLWILYNMKHVNTFRFFSFAQMVCFKIKKDGWIRKTACHTAVLW